MAVRLARRRAGRLRLATVDQVAVRERGNERVFAQNGVDRVLPESMRGRSGRYVGPSRRRATTSRNRRRGRPRRLARTPWPGATRTIAHRRGASRPTRIRRFEAGSRGSHVQPLGFPESEGIVAGDGRHQPSREVRAEESENPCQSGSAAPVHAEHQDGDARGFYLSLALSPRAARPEAAGDCRPALGCSFFHRVGAPSGSGGAGRIIQLPGGVGVFRSPPELRRDLQSACYARFGPDTIVSTRHDLLSSAQTRSRPRAIG